MYLRIASLLATVLLFGACTRVGSETWCENLEKKPKGEWTIDEKKQHVKYCVFGFDSEKWCEKLEEKDKGDWTANEAAEYAKNCVFDRTDEEEAEKDGGEEAGGE